MEETAHNALKNTCYPDLNFRTFPGGILHMADVSRHHLLNIPKKNGLCPVLNVHYVSLLLIALVRRRQYNGIGNQDDIQVPQRPNLFQEERS
jgi:hypothetical protein